MIQAASRRHRLHLAGIPRSGLPLPVAVLADRHSALALFADFVSINFALRRHIVAYSFLQIFLICFSGRLQRVQVFSMFPHVGFLLGFYLKYFLGCLLTFTSHMSRGDAH